MKNDEIKLNFDLPSEDNVDNWRLKDLSNVDLTEEILFKRTLEGKFNSVDYRFEKK